MLRHLIDLLAMNVTGNLPCDIAGPVPTRQVMARVKGRFITAEFGPGAGPAIVGDETTILYRSPIVGGNQFLSIVAGQEVIATASLPDPPTVARAYPPAHGIDTKVAAPLPTRITFFVPGTIPAGPLTTPVIVLPRFSGTRRLDDMKRPLTNQFIFGISP